MIKNYDLFFEFGSKEKKIYLESDIDCSDVPLEWIFSSYINGYGLDNSGLSRNGINKMNYLRDDFNKRYVIEQYFEDFENYFMAIFDQFFYADRGITSSKKNVLSYLNSAKVMAKYQGKLRKEDEVIFDDAIRFINRYKIELLHKDFEPVKVYMPNSWYITPNNHLYNTMGPNGHKEANLIYPLYYDILGDDRIEDPYVFLKQVKKIFNQGFIDKSTFDNYTNLIYDFISIYPEYYYTLSDYEKVRYRMFDKKTYNPKVIKLIAGIISAQAGLYSFFNYLKLNSSNYYEDLAYIKQFRIDDILVRCCGFHKISSVMDKTITTSCINYEEEFREYIKRGWKIDFVKPIILNSSSKKVEEYPEQFLLIKRMHSKNK